MVDSPKVNHRSNVSRNSSNFTRGSQLWGHEVFMWLAGVRIPFIIFAVIFMITYLAVLHFSLEEHEIQMVIMKLFGEGWSWIDSGSKKIIHVTMIDGSIRPTLVHNVSELYDVKRAWSRTLNGIIGSGLITFAIGLPLSWYFVVFARERGARVLERHHERGAILTTADHLKKMIVKSNRDEFEKDAKRLFPDEKLSAVEKKKYEILHKAGIHFPYHIAGMPYPSRSEMTHTMLVGTTGTGKTTLLKEVCEQIVQRKDHAVIFDLTGTFIESFFDPERDFILNPLDDRCPNWSPFNDCHTASEFDTMAASLVPLKDGGSEPFWVLAARTLFVEMCIKLVEQGHTTNKDLADKLMTADLKQIHNMLKNTTADPLTDEAAARMAESIRAVFNTNAKALMILPTVGPKFSLKDWIKGDRPDGSLLFISSRFAEMESNKTLLTVWFDTAMNNLMAQKRSNKITTWFLLDEIQSLHQMPSIERGLSTSRNFGGAVMIGMHSFQQLVTVYGKPKAETMASLARTKFILGTGDKESAKVASGWIGDREIREVDESYSFGFASARDATTVTPNTSVKPLVLPDEIQNMDSLTAYVKFTGSYPTAKVDIAWKDFGENAEGFIPRPDLDLRVPIEESSERKRTSMGDMLQKPKKAGSDSSSEKVPFGPKKPEKSEEEKKAVLNMAANLSKSDEERSAQQSAQEHGQSRQIDPIAMEKALQKDRIADKEPENETAKGLDDKNRAEKIEDAKKPIDQALVEAKMYFENPDDGMDI